MPTVHSNVNSLDALKNTELVGYFVGRLNTLSKNFLHAQRILCKYLDTLSVEDQRYIHSLCIAISTMTEKMRIGIESVKNGALDGIKSVVTGHGSGSIKKSLPSLATPAAEIASLFATLADELTHTFQQLPTLGRPLPAQCHDLAIPLSEIHLASNWTGLNLPSHLNGKKAAHIANNTYSALMSGTFTQDFKVTEEKVKTQETASSVSKCGVITEFSLPKIKPVSPVVIEAQTETLSIKMKGG